MTKNKGGRPSKYSQIESRLHELEKLARYGLTDEQMAMFFDVSLKTFANYKKEHPEFLHTLKKGKLIADGIAIDSLFKRVQGFETEEIITEYDTSKINSENTEAKVKSIKKIKKLIPPDTAACFIWLKNRLKDQWKNTWDNIPIPLDSQIPEFEDWDNIELEKYVNGQNGTN